MQPSLPSGGGTQCSLGIDFTPQSSRAGGAAAKIRAVGDVSGNAGLSLWTATGGSAAAAVERVRIGTDGNVGIGTTLPKAELHVVGNVGIGINNIYPDVKLHVGGNIRLETGLQNIITNGTTEFYQQTIGGLKVRIGAYNYNPTGYLPLDFNDGQLYVKGQNGDVGIGTTNPQSKLDVRGNVILTDNLKIKPTGTYNNGAIELPNSTGSISWWIGHKGADSGYNNGLSIDYYNSGWASRLHIDTSGRIGIATRDPTELLHVAGNILCNQLNVGGSGGAYYRSDRIVFALGSTFYVVNNGPTVGVYISSGQTAWGAQSDERIKTNIVEIADGLQKCLSIRGVQYRYKKDTDDIKRIGVIAQDVLKVLPEVIDESADGTLGVRYTELIPVLFTAIKELNQKITELQDQINALKSTS